MLRRYKEEDINSIVSIEDECLASSLGFDYYYKDLNNSLAKHYVYEIDKEIVGFISSVYDGFTLEILNFAVKKNNQNKGVGTTLLSLFLEEFIVAGVNSVSLEVRKSNTRAINLYSKLGFKIVHERKEYYSNLEDALVMQKLYEPKVDLANLLGIVFCEKSGNKYSSSFIEKHLLNYYDFYDNRVDSLNVSETKFISARANWFDENIFKGFEKNDIALLHLNTNLFNYNNSNYDVLTLDDIEAYLEFVLLIDGVYGLDYASKNYAFLIDNYKKNKLIILVVKDGKKIVGDLVFMKYHNLFYVTNFYVLEAYQNKGYGCALLNALIKYVKQSGLCDIYLDTFRDSNAYNIYLKKGFKQIDQYFNLLKVYDGKN